MPGADADTALCDQDPGALLGHWCELDNDCCDTQLCLAAQCAPQPGACATNDECPVGFTCEAGNCVACVNDLDCPSDQECVDGVCVPATCADTVPDLAGAWSFHSRLDVSEAVSDFVLALGDAAAEACDWLGMWGWAIDLPAWAPDLICLVGDIVLLMHDMQVDHRITFQASGPVTWSSSDQWLHLIFDPDGRHVEVDPALLECPITVDDFTTTYSCDVIYFDRHDVHMPLNGLVQLLLDALACGAMGDSFGCGWDAALDAVCADITDPALHATCVSLIGMLVIPDPCLEFTDMTLAGTGELSAPDAMAGDWAGTLYGDDFSGTFTATRP